MASFSAAGGLSSFKQNHENLCDNSLQLQECREAGAAAAAPGLLPQPVPSTPDIESAELTPILPFLFLGNEQDAQDLDTMQRLNIGYVINVTTHLPLYHYEKGLLNYKRLPATDSSKQNLRQYFEEAFEFIGNYARCPCRRVGHSPGVFPGCLGVRALPPVCCSVLATIGIRCGCVRPPRHAQAMGWWLCPPPHWAHCSTMPVGHGGHCSPWLTQAAVPVGSTQRWGKPSPCLRAS